MGRVNRESGAYFLGPEHLQTLYKIVEEQVTNLERELGLVL